MKNVLKLGLAVLAAATLVACGGGGEATEVADVYVGTWKSACYSTNSSSGTVYTKRIRTIAKISATEIAASNIRDKVFSDAACANVAGTWTENAPYGGRYVIGAKVQFLGANADAYTYTAGDGTTYAGYMALNGAQQLFMADAPTGSAAPTNWGVYSPYTKQ